MALDKQEAATRVTPDSKFRAVFRHIPSSDLDLLMAVGSPAGRRAISKLRQMGKKGHPEVDDWAILLRVAKLMKGQPELSVAAATRQTLATLPDTENTKSGTHNVIAGGRHITRESLQTQLERKFEKHKLELMRRLDKFEEGSTLAKKMLGEPSKQSAQQRGTFAAKKLVEIRSNWPQSGVPAHTITPFKIDGFLMTQREMWRLKVASSTASADCEIAVGPKAEVPGTIECAKRPAGLEKLPKNVLRAHVGRIFPGSSGLIPCSRLVSAIRALRLAKKEKA